MVRGAGVTYGMFEFMRIYSVVSVYRAEVWVSGESKSPQRDLELEPRRFVSTTGVDARSAHFENST